MLHEMTKSIVIIDRSLSLSAQLRDCLLLDRTTVHIFNAYTARLHSSPEKKSLSQWSSSAAIQKRRSFAKPRGH